MSTRQYDETKQWVDTWKKTGPALEKIKQEELRNYDYEKNYKIIDDMLQYACENAEVRLTSGLVELQKFFMKFAKEMENFK